MHADARVMSIGLGAGLLNGLIGIGGGIVMVPGLIFYRQATPQVAVGTSLTAVVVLSGAAFLVHVALAGFLLGVLDLAGVIAAGVVGAQLGGWVLARLTSRRMLFLFAGFIFLMSARLVTQGLELGIESPVWVGAPTWAYLLFGLASGVLSGLFGVGGGALVLLGFAVFYGMPIHAGLPLALAVNVTNALAGSINHSRHGRVLWPDVRRMLPAALGGIVLGAGVALWLPPDWLRIVFGVFFLYMSLQIFRRARAS